MKSSNENSEEKTPIQILNEQILAKTLWIRKNEPELSKFLTEMPISIPTEENPTIDQKNLSDYLDSLNQLIENYRKEHGGVSKSI